MAGYLFRAGTRTILACLLFAGGADLLAGLLAQDTRMTEGAIVLLGLSALVMYGSKRFTIR